MVCHDAVILEVRMKVGVRMMYRRTTKRASDFLEQVVETGLLTKNGWEESRRESLANICMMLDQVQVKQYPERNFGFVITCHS